MKKNITINFKLINDKWTFEICNGEHRYVAGAKDLKEAEAKAFERVKSIPNLGMIHTTYNPGKSIQLPKISYEEELIDQGFRKPVDKTL
jgi:hypothetical protein